MYAVAGHRVLAVTDGEPRPVAGNGESTSSGSEEEDEDGGPALAASLSHPSDVAVTGDGSLFVSTSDGIRRVTPDGDIDTVVTATREGDRTYGPTVLALGPGEDLFFAEPGTHRVRVVVRPAELDEPFRFPWTAFWVGALALVLTVGAVLVLRRRRPARQDGNPVTEG